MDKTRTVGQKWLTKELHLHILTLKKVYQILHKSNTFSDENINNCRIQGEAYLNSFVFFPEL